MLTQARPPGRPGRCVRRTERGSALALVPAGFLVLILLGAMAVDSAVSYLGQQQLHDALTAAANDAASAAIDNATFYSSGRIVIDASTAATVVCESVAAQHFSQLRHVRLWVTTSGRDINVQGSAAVDGVFGRVIPGFATRTVRASVDALADSGAAGGGNAGGRLEVSGGLHTPSCSGP